MKRYGVIMAGVALLSACATSPNYQRPTVITNAKGVPSHYLVKQGDTVSQIAQRYGLSWQEVARLNRLDDNHTIYAGQWLKLWQGGGTSSSRQTALITQAGQTPAVATQARTSTPISATTGRVVVANQAKTQLSQPVSSQAVGSQIFNTHFVYPVNKNTAIVRQFGAVRQINGSTVKSEGVWFSGKDGDVINASRAGTVIYADVNSMPDASVAIRHADGFISEYRFIKNATVKAGQNVETGQRIASIKSTNGVAVMEFRLAKNNIYIDPMSVLK